MDSTRVGQVAAELMESMEDAYPDGSQVGVVAVVVELDIPPSEEAPLGASDVTYRCSDPRPWVQRGFLKQARAATRIED